MIQNCSLEAADILPFPSYGVEANYLIGIGNYLQIMEVEAALRAEVGSLLHKAIDEACTGQGIRECLFQALDILDGIDDSQRRNLEVTPPWSCAAAEAVAAGTAAASEIVQSGWKLRDQLIAETAAHVAIQVWRNATK